MAKFLFAVQPSMGHLNPLLSIAGHMKSAGHEIEFICFGPEKIEKIIRDSSFHVYNMRPSLSAIGFLFLPLLKGYLETFVAIRLFFSGLSFYTRATARILKERQADAVVADFAFPGAFLAAESMNIPYILIYHAGLGFKGPGIPPFGSGLPIGQQWGLKGKVYQFLSDFLEKSIANNMNRKRRKFGLPAGEKADFQYLSSPWLNLVLTSEASEAPRSRLPETAFFIGPCLDGRNGPLSGDFPIQLLSPKKRKIYLSLGTFFNKKPKVFGKIMNALSDSCYQLIVSAGGAYKKLNSRPLPSNFLLFEWVPQLDLLPLVDLVISHGGNNTVNETLAAGKPLLVMPVGGEQGDNARRVEFLGAGLRADIKKFTCREIREKVNRLIEEETFIERAKEIAGNLARTRGSVTATRFIEYVAENKCPIFRPPGYPLTVTIENPPPWERP